MRPGDYDSSFGAQVRDKHKGSEGQEQCGQTGSFTVLPHGPPFDCCALLCSLLEVASHRSAEGSQGEPLSLGTWANVAAPCIETCRLQTICTFLCHENDYFLFQREMRALSQDRIIQEATVEAERRLDLNPEGFPLRN